MQLTPCPACGLPTTEQALGGEGRCLACRKEHETAERVRADKLASRASIRRETVEAKTFADGLRSAEQAEIEARRKTPKELVDAELARRELARRRLLPFVHRFNETYDAGWVHHIICAELETFAQDVIDQKSPRLIIEVPPRHGKSELVSRMFPAWFLGRSPELEVISASHTTSLSMDFSRKVRSIFRSDPFGTVFPAARISDDSQAAEHWRTTRGGGYTAVGVGSAVVGKGCSILLIDDPVAGAEDAESFKSREAVKQWYQTEAYTRLAPGGGVLIIMQRWHDEDLAGWLLARSAAGDGENWRVVRFPAIATEDEMYRKAGEALHPTRYPLHLLEGIRRNMTPRQWEALYQQNPVPEDGSYFLNEHFRFYDPQDLPPTDTLNVYATWDLAIGLKEQNDYTVGYTAGVSRGDDLYILDRRKARWNAMDIVEQVLDAQKAHGAQIVGLEKGHIQMTLGPFLNKRMAERRQFGFLLHPLMVGRRDKLARARSIQGRMQQGRVFWPRGAPWLADAMRELLRFPNGAHDDDADALAHLGLLLDEMVVTREPVEKEKKSWRDRITKTLGHTTRSAMSA